MFDLIQNWDAGVLLWMQENLRQDFVTVIMKAISMFGNSGIGMIALTVIFLFPKKTRRTGVCSGLALAIGAVTVNLILKPLVLRPRPYVTYDKLEPLLKEIKDPHSFPSGHTQAAFALAVSICLVLRKKLLSVLSLAFAVLMGFSRLYVGAHYPSDVIIGAIIGTAAAFAAYGILRRIERKVPPEKLPWPCPA